MSSSASFKWNNAKVTDIRRGVMTGLLRMGTDIASRARYNAPYLSGALRNSIRVTTDSKDTVDILAGGEVGGERIGYALVRERYNKKHPSTTRYMERAFDSVTSGNLKQYFGDLA